MYTVLVTSAILVLVKALMDGLVLMELDWVFMLDSFSRSASLSLLMRSFVALISATVSLKLVSNCVMDSIKHGFHVGYGILMQGNVGV